LILTATVKLGQATIKGVITDINENTPLPAATIFIKATTMVNTSLHEAPEGFKFNLMSQGTYNQQEIILGDNRIRVNRNRIDGNIKN
jgi:hypothetical protein